jgi:hypothetical protein
LRATAATPQFSECDREQVRASILGWPGRRAVRGVKLGALQTDTCESGETLETQKISERKPPATEAFLEEGKADEGLSFSMVDHMRWDLSAILEMAVAEKGDRIKPGDAPLHAEAGAEREDPRNVRG